MIRLRGNLRKYVLLAGLAGLAIFTLKNVDFNTVEWVLRGAPSVGTERPSGEITLRGQDFSLRDFRQLLRRDAIKPVYEPAFVSAEESGFSDEELVLGVEINGDSRAYPIGPLNSREMVIDEVGGVPILVSW